MMRTTPIYIKNILIGILFYLSEWESQLVLCCCPLGFANFSRLAKGNEVYKRNKEESQYNRICYGYLPLRLGRASFYLVNINLKIFKI